MSDGTTTLYSGHYLGRSEPSNIRETTALESQEPLGSTTFAPATDPVQDVSDEKLLAALANGDRDSLALLFRRHAAAVGRVATRILRDPGEADDLVQDVFLFVFRKAFQFDPNRASARSWIIQMAYHRAFDRRRHLLARYHHRTEEISEDMLRVSGAKDVEQVSIDVIAGRELLTKCRDCLSSEQRETLQLFFFEGHELKEIAERTGQSLVNVRNHYYRGLKQLRSRLLPKKVLPR